MAFSGAWIDPSHEDLPDVASVRDVMVVGNASKGKYPGKMLMTGNCVDYKGSMFIYNNIAPTYNFYCKQVVLKGNK